MTRPGIDVDLVAAQHEFKTLLPHYVTRQMHNTQRLGGLLYTALQHGWTVNQLARECGRDLAGVTNPAAVVMWRLEQAADQPPPDRHKPTRLPLCGQCEAGWLVDPTTRLPVRRCRCRTTQPERTSA